MAHLSEATPLFKVSVSPGQGQATSENSREGQTNHIVRLSDTNLAALNDFIAAIKAGTDVSTVVTAINAL